MKMARIDAVLIIDNDDDDNDNCDNDDVIDQLKSAW